MKSFLDRRLIYFLVILVVSLPLITGYSLPAVKMQAADRIYSIVDNLEIKAAEIVLVAFDFGPNSKAENLPQTELFIEHLMRKRLPFAVFSQYPLAEGFLKTLPQEIAEKLNKEIGETWTYGVDWVNLGFRPGNSLFIQSLAKSKNLRDFFKKDAQGNDLNSLSVFKNVKTLKDIKLVGEFTGLTGVFDTYVQFLKSDGYSPQIVHGCTSITIPDSYIYLDTGQIVGLFEGLAGAAWYSSLLNKEFPSRHAGKIEVTNTALGIGELLILFLILLGNIFEVFSKTKK